MSAALSLQLLKGEATCRVQNNKDYGPKAYDGAFIEELSNRVYCT
jgi:hypothetical protein